MTFFETDNDQKTLGTLKDNILRINATIEDKIDKLKFAKNFVRSSINQFPLGARAYKFAYELMKLEIEKLN